MDMATTPEHPREAEELDNETKAILTERMQAADEDAKTARDARVVIAELREKLKRPASR